MKHKGFCTHRLKDNPEELRFAEAWEKINEQGNVLAHLMDVRSVHGGSPPEPPASASTVAATIVQWLGSHVGQNFLRDLGYECPNHPTNGLIVGDKIRDNDPRHTNRVLTIKRFLGGYVFVADSMGREHRVAIRRIHQDGKKRRGGFDLVRNT